MLCHATTNSLTDRPIGRAHVALLLIAACLSAPSTLAAAGIDGGGAGAQVVVDGTQLGNVTNSDGYYFILNVPPGRRDITFTFTGYQKTTIANQLILAGQTTTVYAQLSATVVQLDGIMVEAEAEPLIIGAADIAAVAAKRESCKNCRRVRFVIITSPKKLKSLTEYHNYR